MNIFDVLTYGSVVAGNEVLGLVVMFDGEHLKLFSREDETYRFVEMRHLCQYLENPCRWKMTVGAAEELAKMWLVEVREGRA